MDQEKLRNWTLFTQREHLFKLRPNIQTVSLDETHLDAVREPIEPRGFHPSASTSRARPSDAAMSDKDKQIFFLLMPRTQSKVEEFRLE